MAVAFHPDRQETALTALRTSLLQLHLDPPITCGGLTVVPITGPVTRPALEYLTLAAAIDAGDLAITEQADPDVPTLEVYNRGRRPVLVIDGEEVVGGRQNRIVNTSLLIPPRTRFALPVSCVEHGRWHETTATFSAGETAYPSLRRHKIEQVSARFATGRVAEADQSAVWREIGRLHQATRTASATGALRDAYLAQAAALERFERTLRWPKGHPIGVVVIVGGRVWCADLFDRSETLRAHWSRLMRSYALEAAEARPAAPDPESAHRLLERPFRARLAAYPSPGLGFDVRIAGNGVVGAALGVSGVAVHTALFRRRRGGPGVRRAGIGRVRDPAARRGSPGFPMAGLRPAGHRC